MYRKLRQIDYGGSLLCMAGSTLVILSLNWGGTSFAWVSGPVLGCLISGIATFALFILYEGKLAKIPVVPRGFTSLGWQKRRLTEMQG